MSSAPDLAIPARVDSPMQPADPSNGLTRWLLQHRVHQPVGPEADEAHAEPQAWWKIMCLGRRRLLLHPVVPAGYRGARGGGTVSVGPVVREIIREHEDDVARRPGIHVG